MNEQNMIVELRLHESGCLKAFANLTMLYPNREMTICGFRIVKKEDKEPWIAFPTSTYTKDGKVVNKEIIEVSKVLRREISELILAEYKKAVKDRY